MKPGVWSLVVAATLSMTACSAQETPQVATAQDPHAVASAARSASASASVSASPEASAALSDYDKALRYTRCMTENGVPTKDPVEGDPLVTYNHLGRTDTADSFAARVAAHRRCAHFLPATWPVTWDPKEIARSRRYVACMRKNGITQGWPDGDGIAQMPTDAQFWTTPEYDAAVAKCRHLVDDPANDQPENQQ
jgi:hypothetical protein